MKTILIAILFFSLSVTAKAQLDSSITPIRLSYFEAATNTSNTTLHWKTVCYLEYANFEILRSTYGSTFQSIHNFTADRLRCQQPFDYTDIYTSASGQVLYKINVNGIDGKAYQSKIIAVFTKGKGFTVNSFTPTIVNSTATISISSAVAETIQLSLINMQGLIVKQQSLSVTKGASTHQLLLDGIQNGNYHAVFTSQKGEKNVIRFIKH